MDLFTAMKIASMGMAAQRTRLEVSSSNLANAQSTRTPEGGPYKKKNPVFSEVKAASFEKDLDRVSKRLSGVEVSQIQTDNSPGARVFDPGHPDADKDGYVNMPNVNVVSELTDIMSTSRSYEANVTAMKAAKEMINSVLSIGRSG